MNSAGRLRFQCDQFALVRAAHHTTIAVPPWPDLADTSPEGVRRWCDWMRATWRIPEIADAVRHATPALGRELDALPPDTGIEPGAARKMMLSLAGYCLRATGRPTPFGLFAGVVEARFGSRAAVHWGEGHRAVARADGGWLARIIIQLENITPVRERLSLLMNNVAVLHGERLVIPWQQRKLKAGTTAVREVSVRHTPQVRAILELTNTPIPYGVVADELVERFPALGTPEIGHLLDELLSRRILISSLNPPATEPDALGYIVHEMERTGADQAPEAAGLAESLREIHRLMEEHNQRPAAAGGEHRELLAERMTSHAEVREPLAVDLHLDGEVTLPRAVAWEAESAAAALARISPHPYGTPAWREYRERFLARYGPQVMVPLLDLTDPTTGIGLPDDFHGTPRAARPPVSRRDGALLDLAQQAVMCGEDLELDENLIARLAVGDPSRMQVPPHTELLVELHCASRAALDEDRFELALRGVSRGMGNFTGGRFAALLASGSPSGILDSLARRPTSVEGALAVQLSFPALPPEATHITRAPHLQQHLISLSEHRSPHPETIPLSDLAVTCDGARLHLVSLSRGQVLEAGTPHPLQIECQTPWTARFLDELVRGQSVRIVGPAEEVLPFDWGAARKLRVLPGVRHQRTVLSPARWLLTQADLPDRAAGTAQWEDAFTAMRVQLSVPDNVLLEYFDRRLRLNLGDPGHLALLRNQMERPKFGALTLTRAAAKDAYGWCDGRPTEIVTLMRAAAKPLPSPVTRTAAPARRSLARLPGASAYLCAQLYGQPQARRDLIADHLPSLLAGLGHPSSWFAYHDLPDPCLELCVRLRDAEAFGPAARELGSWAENLVETGVLGGIALVPYRPQIGQWGSGALLTAAEDVFASDSTVLSQQFVQDCRTDFRVLAAANVVDITTGFLGVQEGLSWLAAQPNEASPTRLPRSVQIQAARLVDPSGTWAALRALPGGSEIVHAFSERREALTSYRSLLDQGEAPASDTVLDALLREHYLRSAGSPPYADGQRAGWRLARSVALDPRRNTSQTGG